MPSPSKKHLAGDRLYGRGTAVGTWFVFVGPSAATVHLNADGSATLVTAGVEIGSGSMMQSLPQIVANALGLRPDDVVVRAADTDAAGYDVGVGGGRTTVSLGAASLAACGEVRKKLLDVAAQMLEADPEDLVLRTAGSRSSGPKAREQPSRPSPSARKHLPVRSREAAPLRDRASPRCRAARPVISSRLWISPCSPSTNAKSPSMPETGHVEVLSYRVVQDVGRALNPRAIFGQIQGGVTQGLGYALHEEISIGANGRILQNGFETYRVPLAQDVVPVEISLFEGAPSIGPLGTKGAGEVPILNVGAAIACAVSNAIGRRVQELPLTPPRVLELILGNNRPLKFRPHRGCVARQRACAASRNAVKLPGINGEARPIPDSPAAHRSPAGHRG